MDEEVSDVHVEEQEDDTQSDMNTSSTAQSTKRPTSSGTGLTKRQKKESQEDELMKRAIACMENRLERDRIFSLPHSDSADGLLKTHIRIEKSV